jgi:hypothetical protein
MTADTASSRVGVETTRNDCCAAACHLQTRHRNQLLTRCSATMALELPLATLDNLDVCVPAGSRVLNDSAAKTVISTDSTTRSAPSL